MSHILVLSSFATAFAVLGAVLAEPEHANHKEHFMTCSRTCADCQVTCDACFRHCSTLVADGKKEHAESMQLCADCAEFCKLAATLSARHSPFAVTACEGCAKTCDTCAAACEKFSDDKMMVECAKTCRKCAEECKKMVQMVK